MVSSLGIVAAAAWRPTTAAAAQTNTGEIVGVVRDLTGAPVPDAVVTAMHPDSGTTVTRVADREGRFLLPALRIGRWELVATLDGVFAAGRLTVVLELGRTINVEFALGVFGVTESIQVEATRPFCKRRPPKSSTSSRTVRSSSCRSTAAACCRWRS